jgi:hypothetical protein
MKVVKDKFGVSLKKPNRTCKDCNRYPCFTGIDKCVSDFAKYGCINYEDRCSFSQATSKQK